jgi:hypothetical protein
MRRHLATIAAIGVSAMLGTIALAADDSSVDTGLSPEAENDNNITNDLAPGLQDLLPFPKLGPKAAMLDLGIDLTDVPLTAQGAATFLASLDPEAQRVVITSCSHFLTTPNSAQATYTIQFCEALLGG